MSSALKLDASYISLIYSNDVAEIAKTATLYEHNPDKHKLRFDLVTQNLVSLSEKLMASMAEPLKIDFNRSSVKLTYKRYEGNYCTFEDTLRKIFQDVFNVKLEQSDIYKSQRTEWYGGDINADLQLRWGHHQAKELRLLLGQNQLQEPADAKKVRRNEFRKTGQFCDYTLLVQGKEFRVHKVVLAEYSDYFVAFFTTNFKESAAQKPVKFGEDDLTHEVFEALLQYIYTGEVDLSNTDANLFIQLAYLAKLVMDEKLQQLCVTKLLSLINKESFFDISQFAIVIEDRRLTASCRNYLAQNKSFIDAIDYGPMCAKQLVDTHHLGAVLECEELKNVASKLIISKIDKDNLQGLCEAVNTSRSPKLKDEFKAAAFAFASNNKELVQSDAMKPARKAYKELMTGLERPEKKQKTEK